VRLPFGTIPNGTIVTNQATISADNAPSNSSSFDVSAIAFSNPLPDKYFLSGGAAGGYTTYTLEFCNNSNASSFGALTLEDIVIIDTLPPGAIFVQVNPEFNTTANYDSITRVATFTKSTLQAGECMYPKITVLYPDSIFPVGSTTTNTAHYSFTPVGEDRDTLSSTDSRILAPGSPYSIWNANDYIITDSLGLIPEVEYITSINWCFGDVPAGFASFEPISLDYEVMANAPIGTITNCSVLSSTTVGATLTNDCVDLLIEESIPGTRLNPIKRKLPSNETNYDQGEIFPFQITIRNEISAADSVENPIIYDLLPEHLSFQPGSWFLPSFGMDRCIRNKNSSRRKDRPSV